VDHTKIAKAPTIAVIKAQKGPKNEAKTEIRFKHEISYLAVCPHKVAPVPGLPGHKDQRREARKEKIISKSYCNKFNI
jgi:hypothetical protein